MSILKVFGFIDQYLKEKEQREQNENLICLNEPNSYIAEQYSSIVSKIINTKGDNFKTIVITSCLPDEGKTTTACNLGICLANTFDQKVLIVDADLRKPSLGNFFNLENEEYNSSGKGLTKLLSKCSSNKNKKTLKYSDLKDHIIKSSAPRLSLLLTGAEALKPGLLLNSPAMEILDSALKEEFDVVIYDTPPVMFTSDAQAVGKIADLVLFVVRAETTSRRTIKDALTRLRDTGAEPDATILTGSSQPIDILNFMQNYKYKKYYRRE